MRTLSSLTVRHRALLVALCGLLAWGPGLSRSAEVFPISEPGAPVHTPSVASSGNRFAAAWIRANEAAPPDEIVARVFDANGTPLIPSVTVSDPGPYSQSRPRVAVSSDGFLVTWTLRAVQSPADYVTVVRAYDLDGSPLSAVTALPSSEAGGAPLALDDDSYLVVWKPKAAAVPSQSWFQAQIFARDGTAETAVIDIDLGEGVPARSPSSARVSGTEFILAWKEERPEYASAVAWQRFGVDGFARGPRFLAEPPELCFSQGVPAIATNVSGQVALGWHYTWMCPEDRQALRRGNSVQVFDTDGTARSPLIDIPEPAAWFPPPYAHIRAMTTLSSDGFIFVRTSPSLRVVTRPLDASGGWLGPVLPLSTGSSRASAAAPLPDGQAVVVWDRMDASGALIEGRILEPSALVSETISFGAFRARFGLE